MDFHWSIEYIEKGMWIISGQLELCFRWSVLMLFRLASISWLKISPCLASQVAGTARTQHCVLLFSLFLNELLIFGRTVHKCKTPFGVYSFLKCAYKITGFIMASSCIIMVTYLHSCPCCPSPPHWTVPILPSTGPHLHSHHKHMSI